VCGGGGIEKEKQRKMLIRKETHKRPAWAVPNENTEKEESE
jgi:hypothetical protein